jgi:AraC family transcriptional activator of pobA
MTVSNNAAPSLPVRARSLQVMLREGRWRLESYRSRDEHTFLWVTRGQGRITIGTQTRGIGPNTVIHIPAGTPHAIVLAPTAQGHAVHAHQSLTMPVPSGPAMIRAANVFEQGQITSYFENLLAEIAADKTGVEQAAESYLTLLSVWIERHARYNDWTPPPETRGERLLTAFQRAIEADGARMRPVSAVATDLGITPTHLTRLCKSVHGKSAQAMIRDRVLLEACLRLKDGTASAAELSRQLGFASPAHFNRQFRAQLSMTPLAFRAATEKTGEISPARRVIRQT